MNWPKGPPACELNPQPGPWPIYLKGKKTVLSEYLKVFRVGVPVGALFAINDEVVGLECFGHQQTFSKFFQKLIQSYALDALDWPGEEKEGQVPAAAVRRFLEGVRRAPKKAYPSLGLGGNLRSRVRSFPGQPWCMREGFCTFRPLATQGKGKMGQRFLFSDFPKGEKGKILTAEIAENAEKKGLKFFLNNYTIFAISIGFALSGFPRKTSNTAEMRF